MPGAGINLWVVLVFAGTVLCIWSLIWVYADAKSRGKAGWLVALLVLCCWPIGLLLWLALRPRG